MTAPKILLTDIETFPAKVYAFGLFNQNFSLAQIVEHDRMAGFSAKWYGSKRRAMWWDERGGRIEMLTAVRDLLDEADVVVHYNGRRFDVPWIRGELASEGIDQPSPFKQIDLYHVAKKNMRFISHKLDWVSEKLLGDRKVSHSGFKLWADCMAGDEKAWAMMRKYGIKDTDLLEPLFDGLKQFTPQAVNLGMYASDDGERRCSHCGKTDTLQSRGIERTAQSEYRRYWCNTNTGGCGGWSRGTQRIKKENPVQIVGVAL